MQEAVLLPEAADAPEIQIGAETIFTGTGGWQYNLVIIKLFDGILTVVFDQPELVNWSHPISVGAKSENGIQRRDQLHN